MTKQSEVSQRTNTQWNWKKWQSGNNGRAELIISPNTRTISIFRGSDAGVVNWAIGINNGLLDSTFWYFID